MNTHTLNSFQLKMIAIVTMLIDHVGAVFFPELEWMRWIGRLAFPIFCFILVEGYFHTRSVPKYLFRLWVFAMVSEVPFDLLFVDNTNIFSHQNIFFTLFIGLLAIYCMDLVVKTWENNYILTTLLEVGIAIVACFAAYLLRTDYSMLGIMYIVIFYLYRGKNLFICVCLGILNFGMYGVTTQMYSLVAIPIIACYNGEKGRSMKYFFYAFYPAHLFILYALYHVMKG